jgi:hypothetical protein
MRDDGERSYVLWATMVLRAAGKQEQAEKAEDQHDDEKPAVHVKRHHRSPHTGSRTSGQVMQWPPPRPLPSSKPSIVITSTPASRIFAIV